MLLPVSRYLLQLATTRLRSVNYATSVLRFMVCMTVSVCSTVFRMETSCSLLKNVSSAMKREAEDSSKIFIETAVLQHWLCLDVSTGGTGGVSSWLQAVVQRGSLCVAPLTEHKRCSLQNACTVQCAKTGN